MKQKLRKVLLIAAVASVAIAALVLWRLRDGGRGVERSLESSGTVEVTEVHLGFPSGGRLEAVMPREGEKVTGGAELAHLDGRDALARRQQAAAQAAAARAQLAELEHGSRGEEIRAARAARDAARARFEQAKEDLSTARALYQRGTVTRDAYDKTALAFEVARGQLIEAEQQLELVRSGPRSERIAAQRQQVALADAGVASADAALANAVIKAPFDGLVTVRHREPGEIVPPGTAVLTVMDPNDRWVRIYVKENRIGAVRIGMPAIITSDTYPDERHEGEVTFIASEAEFTPKNVQTQEERVKLVYAVKVKIEGDPEQHLKPGMPVDVELGLAPPGAPMSRR